jgi:hypothetical protein
MALINQTQVTVGDYAYAGTWENPLNGAPSLVAKVCTITTEATPRRLGDKGDVRIDYNPTAMIDPNGQEVSDGRGGTITIAGLPVIPQSMFYLYFRKLILDALANQPGAMDPAVDPAPQP